MPNWNVFGEAKHNKNGPPSPAHQVSPTEAITLQTLMEIKESIGGLKSDIKSLEQSSKDSNIKIDSIHSDVTQIKEKITFIKGALWVIGIISSAAIGLTVFYVSNHDKLTSIKESQTISTTPAVQKK